MQISVIEKVRQTLISHSMTEKGGNVIICLSGGADSVCLLEAMGELAEEFGIKLSAVHVNHQLRGEESDGDMRFCEDICRKKRIALQIFSVDVRKLSEEKGLSLEEAARELRYKAFAQAAEKIGGARLATAHNKCDSSETVLFNLTRGTGTKGLCGIPYVRGNIIRPLLDVTREEIEAFLKERDIPFVTDSTNLGDDYSRNRIRHRVIPELISINGGFYESAARLSQSAGEDEEYFEALLESIPEGEICSYTAAVRKRYIRKKLTEKDISCSFDRINILDDMLISGKISRYELKKDIFAVFDGKSMEIKEIRRENYPDIRVSVDIDKDISVEIPEYDKTVKIERIADDNFNDIGNVQKKLTNEHLNYDKIQGVVTLRNKKDGDVIGLVGRDFDTRLKKLFSSLKLTAKERKTALVMEDEAGLIWSEYGGVSRRVYAGKGCPNVLRITVIKRG